MERKAMNPRGKGALDSECSERKRHCSISRELLAEVQNDSLFTLDPRHIEAIIRPMVAEEVDRAFSRLASAFQGAPLQQITGSQARRFRLQFKTNPAAKSFTDSDLVGEHGDTICVFLIDAATDQPVTDGPESRSKLEVVPLIGDFCTSEEQEWSAEKFEKHVAKPREGRGPLLVGDLEICLRNGQGTLGQIYFTENSSFTKSKKFGLGVRVAHDNHYGLMSVQEGKSQAFSVLDSRGKAYRKHDTPSPTDDVWRLQNIRKNGPFHTKLQQNGINMVREFLFCLVTRPELLKDVLCKMPEKAYQATIGHAKKCILGGKLYIYPVEQPPYESLIFKANYQVAGAVVQGRFVRLEMIDGIEKVRFDGLVRSAYHHWDTNVTEHTIQDHWDTNVTEHTIQDLSEPIMIGAIDAEDMVNVAAAPQEVVSGSFAENIVNVAAAPQEAVHGSLGAEGVPTLEPNTEQGYVDGDVTEEWASQEHIAGIDMANWSEELRIDETQLWEVADGEVASQVQHVFREEYGGPFELFPFNDPTPPVGKWWLRIRSVVRCALFIRRARSL